jgi:hypothetical protein
MMNDKKRDNTWFEEKLTQNRFGSFSDFWIPASQRRRDSNFLSTGEIDIDELMRLSHIQKAVSNFVRIMTGKNIPVRFHTGQKSYTSGKTVTISSGVTDKNFDATVGIALHESGHILFSDFTIFDSIWQYIPDEVYDDAEKLHYTRELVSKKVFQYCNWIEDRRIDSWTFANRPGYRGYFLAMYAKYFHSKWIDKALKSSDLRDESMKAYDFRVKNLMNKNTDLDALRGLREIAALIDLKNIDRLQSTKETFEVALQVFKVILKYLAVKTPTKKVDKKTPKPKQPKKQQKPFDPEDENYEPADEDEEDGDGDPSDEPSEKGEPKEDPSNLDPADEPDEEPTDDTKTDDESTDETKDDETPVDGKMPSEPGEEKKDDEEEFDEDEVTKGDGDLNDNAKKELDKAIEKQDEFLDDEIPKTKIAEDTAKKLDAVNEAGSSIVDVDYKDNDYTAAFKVPVLFVKNVTEAFFKDPQLCVFSSWRPLAEKQPEGMYQEYVTKGITLGKLLGRKLQIRNEVTTTKDIRKATGRVERRLLASLGYGNMNVMSQTSTEQYPKACVHLSIDASGSMGGDRLGKALTAAVAIAKFCSMNSSLYCVISIRASQEQKPIVAIVYDSRRDKFTKVQWMFPYLKTFGSTPEGLCFAAIQKEIESSNADLKSYFINLSDGEPCFSIDVVKEDRNYRDQQCSYGKGAGVRHTRGEVNKMRSRGINVLSYFISETGSSYIEDFKTMYGRDAREIDTNSLPQLAKTLEELFLRKD